MDTVIAVIASLDSWISLSRNQQLSPACMDLVRKDYIAAIPRGASVDQQIQLVTIFDFHAEKNERILARRQAEETNVAYVLGQIKEHIQRDFSSALAGAPAS